MKEAARYKVLQRRLAAKEIRNLRIKPSYYFQMDEKMLRIRNRKGIARTMRYEADFAYEEKKGDAWIAVVEDVKGMATPAYKIKAALMELFHNIRVREI